MHGVPLGDNFGPMWHVPQCRGGDVGVTCFSRAALAFWLVLAAPGSAGDLALFLPRLPCARCVTAWSDISDGPCPSCGTWQCEPGVPFATGLWGMDPLVWAAPSPPAPTSLPQLLPAVPVPLAALPVPSRRVSRLGGR